MRPLPISSLKGDVKAGRGEDRRGIYHPPCSCESESCVCVVCVCGENNGDNDLPLETLVKTES